MSTGFSLNSPAISTLSPKKCFDSLKLGMSSLSESSRWHAFLINGCSLVLRICCLVFMFSCSDKEGVLPLQVHTSPVTVTKRGKNGGRKWGGGFIRRDGERATDPTPILRSLLFFLKIVWTWAFRGHCLVTNHMF